MFSSVPKLGLKNVALSFLGATSKRAVEAILMVHKDKDTRLFRTSTALHVTPDK